MTSRLAHNGDPDTSHDAAERLSAATIKRVKDAIVYLLADTPRAVHHVTESYFVFALLFGWPRVKADGIAKRMSELHNDGVIRDSGQRVTGRYGRPVVVWELTPREESE